MIFQIDLMIFEKLTLVQFIQITNPVRVINAKVNQSKSLNRVF
jgi:hypothetical protein